MAADRAGFMEVVCLEGVAAGKKVVEVCEMKKVSSVSRRERADKAGHS